MAEKIDYNNNKAQFDMSKLILESWGKQRQRILDAATMVHERNHATIEKSLSLYYASLRSLYDEYYPYIKTETRDVNESSDKNFYFLDGTNIIYKQKSTQKEVVKVLDLVNHLFRVYDKSIKEWKKYNTDNKTNTIPNISINILTKIHRLLHDLAQWSIGVGIRLQRSYADTEKINRAI